MNEDRFESEQIDNHLGDNWIGRAKLYAEELKILRIKIRNQSINDMQLQESLLSTDFFSEYKSKWGLRIRKYLEAESRSKEPASNPTAAVKLATVVASTDKVLVSAIELAKSGYVICGLHSILQIVRDEGVRKEERVDAILLALENLIASINAIQKSKKNALSSQDLLFSLDFAERLTKTLQIAMNATDENLISLSDAILELIALADGKTSPIFHKVEANALRVAEERKDIVKRLSDSSKKPVIRSIHHLACTGGTLISKCLASMHNVALISEVNPLNRSGGRFEPTNPLLLLERSHREFSVDEKIEIFRTQVNQAYKICQEDDVDLVLRDHSHTDFHIDSNTSGLCPIRDCLSDTYDIISVVTIRHPLDSYLSLVSNGWDKCFSPRDINEYSRRYLAFIDKYSDLPFVRYEEFCDDPVSEMKSICESLSLQYNSNFLEEFGKHVLTGDSGRMGLEIIEQRPKREIPESLEASIKNSEYYLILVKRLGY